MNVATRKFYGDRYVWSGDNVTKPTGLLDGAFGTVLGSNRTYILSGNSWTETNPIGFRTYFNVPTAGWTAGTIIGLSGYTYNSGFANELQVFMNGILQRVDSTQASADNDYVNVNTTGVKFNYALASGGIVQFIGFR